ncbi:MAG TPA: IMP dehydrogenase, partial [Anaerolineales bacterium]
MNEELFQSHEALTFDDLLIVPGYTSVLPDQTDIRARLTRGITLNIPIVSAAMDTVTEGRMAIALAREGGIGIIHRNLSPEAQAVFVEQVKRSESGMITDPVTLGPTATLREAEDLMGKFHISGIPITEPGSGGKLVGILTNRDIRFLQPGDFNKPVSEFMTKDKLVTAPVGTTLEQAKSILQKNRIEKLPLVDSAGRLKGLITVKDIQKKMDFPVAAIDSQGRLLVGAAVGVGADLETRVGGLIEAGVDLVAIDTAHGHSEGVLQAIAR